MSTLYMLCKTFWNFIGIVMKHDNRDFIDQILNQLENVHKKL